MLLQSLFVFVFSLIMVHIPATAMNSKRPRESRLTDAELVGNKVSELFGCLADACLREDSNSAKKIVNSRQFRTCELLTLRNSEISPLHIAAATGNANLVRILLDANIASYIPERDSDGKTCLHNAVDSESYEVLELLVQKFKNQINCADDEHHTPLFLAQEQHKESKKESDSERAKNAKRLIALLVQHGAQRQPTKREKKQAELRVKAYKQELASFIGFSGSR